MCILLFNVKIILAWLLILMGQILHFLFENIVFDKLKSTKVSLRNRKNTNIW